MDHAAFIIFVLARLFTLETAEGQSNQWYNWFEDNTGKRLIENGILPTLSCPFGHYRKFKGAPHEPGGINLDGCLKCPQGVFGNTTDLTSPNCTAPCPLGTFSDEEGLESIEGCKKCPAGTYGDKEGLKTPACSGSCVDLNRLEFNELYFSMDTGLISSEQCELCPFDYNYHSCKWNITAGNMVQSVPHYYEGYYFLDEEDIGLWDPLW